MEIEVGDVVQITEKHGRAGWIGCLVLVTEVKSWGVMGCIHYPQTHEAAADIWIRLSFAEVERVGAAPLCPAPEAESAP